MKKEDLYGTKIKVGKADITASGKRLGELGFNVNIPVGYENLYFYIYTGYINIGFSLSYFNNKNHKEVSVEELLEKPSYSFKVGDIVECVKDGIGGTPFHKGSIHRISHIKDNYIYDINGGWYKENFRHVVIRAWDKVRCIEDHGIFKKGFLYKVKGFWDDCYVIDYNTISYGDRKYFEFYSRPTVFNLLEFEENSHSSDFMQLAGRMERSTATKSHISNLIDPILQEKLNLHPILAEKLTSLINNLNINNNENENTKNNGKGIKIQGHDSNVARTNPLGGTGLTSADIEIKLGSGHSKNEQTSCGIRG
jgi:hypothetical protein